MILFKISWAFIAKFVHLLIVISLKIYMFQYGRFEHDSLKIYGQKQLSNTHLQTFGILIVLFIFISAKITNTIFATPFLHDQILIVPLQTGFGRFQIMFPLQRFQYFEVKASFDPESDDQDRKNKFYYNHQLFVIITNTFFTTKWLHT